MASEGAAENTAAVPDLRRPPVPVKILISGGFGVGKTTAVTTISEIAPLTTEAVMTTAGVAVDDASLLPGKSTTTVAMDFGRVTIDESVKLYVFGTPGQDRFGFMWSDLAQGALGALVMVDDRRIDDCYAAVDYFETLGLPFVVAVNRFDGLACRDLETVRWALAVAPDVPVIEFDAREFASVRDAVLVLLEEALARARARTAGSGVSAPTDRSPTAHRPRTDPVPTTQGRRGTTPQNGLVSGHPNGGDARPPGGGLRLGPTRSAARRRRWQ